MTLAAIDSPLRILVVGAHPDDAEFHVGGTMLRYTDAGHSVHALAITDGGAGHHELATAALIARRTAEATEAARRGGYTSEVWDAPDGSLEPSVALRQRLIRRVREFAPDLLITHRTCDYHPDHRAVGQLVQDASFLLRVPRIAPEVTPPAAEPVVMYMADFFTRPTPFRADVVVAVDAQLERVVELLDAHASQVYEWLPWLDRRTVPNDAAARRAWLREWYASRPRAIARRHREQLQSQNATTVEFAEALEESEYARHLDGPLRMRLFACLAPR